MGQYTKEYITSILLILQKNNFDIAQTARDEKINRQTIYRWKEKYGVEVWQDATPVKVEPVVVQSDSISISSSKIKGKAEDVVLKLLKLIDKKLTADLLEEKISLRELTNTLDKTIPYILSKFESKGDEGANSMENTYNIFVQNMYNKLNDKDHAR